MDVRGKHVVVLGLAASGRAAAELALQRGARVTGLDLREDVQPIEGVRLELGPHREDTLRSADILVVSPGVPARVAAVTRARDAGAFVVGELGFAFSFLEEPVIIGVTGTNGKSTVTWLTGQLLRAAGRSCFVGGNLGRPLSRSVLEGESPDVYVVEVSSYQLELPGDLHVHIAAILNLSPDHLARHGDMDGYAHAKGEIFERQAATDWAFVARGDARLEAQMSRGQGRRGWLGALPGWSRQGAQADLQLDGATAGLDLSEVQLAGEHNLDNAATAGLLAWAVGVDVADIQRALPALTALEHRMETVPTDDGLLWINDSKGTNLDAAKVGIGGLDRPAVVLLGGEAKAGSDFGELGPLLARHRAVVAFGGSGPMVADQLRDTGIQVSRVGSMAEAVARARTLAHPGDAVLLSPGCASFDEFDNFEHRGRVFRDLAQEAS